MAGFLYHELDKLTPCRACGSRRWWFDADVWQCWNCRPPPSEGVIRVELTERVN